MKTTDVRFVAIPLKLPHELLARLDAYAQEHCGNNRSYAIRKAIEQLLAEGFVNSNSKNPEERR